MTKIKMCGLRRPEDIEFANRVKPDYIGYVFAEKSKRYIATEKAAELTKLRSHFGCYVPKRLRSLRSCWTET